MTSDKSPFPPIVEEINPDKDNCSSCPPQSGCSPTQDMGCPKPSSPPLFIIILGLIIAVVSTLFLLPSDQKPAWLSLPQSKETPQRHPSTMDRLPAPQISNQQMTSSGLTATEIHHLMYMREEEKMARDVYVFLMQKWKTRLFTSISRSEQRHMDRVGMLIQHYGLPDPVSNHMYGAFNNRQIQQLYNRLIQQGSTSQLNALMVGALIEEVDIHDLEQAIRATQNSDLIRIYKNIQRGSRNHLRTFAHALEMMGYPYKAQHLPQEEVIDIITSPTETGPF
ncbi:DUF2202 domain-containing protein [Magnetococcales bacterium HHB-1]